VMSALWSVIAAQAGSAPAAAINRAVDEGVDPWRKQVELLGILIPPVLGLIRFVSKQIAATRPLSCAGLRRSFV
jgi:hypothetical protein